ncbi:AIR synthase related protein [Eubacterium sp.]|uniref:AIR synthase related protein n=1 Tax=Eubacterium sp. TaxID=142586 RepID=UPI002FC8578C
MTISKYRDLTLASIPGGTVVVAADSCGSTGEKSEDFLKCPPYHCGRVSARVVLFELLCIGAEVLILADGICSEMHPTGEAIIQGFSDELKLAGLSPDCLTGSTEENFPTSMTGVGTAAVGYLPGTFTPPHCQAGDILLCIGTPLVGMAFLTNTKAPLATYDHLKELWANPQVHELVPVGSKGIAYEARTIAGLHQLSLQLDADCPLDLCQSGGPSSCVLAVAAPEAQSSLMAAFPAFRVGTLLSR